MRKTVFTDSFNLFMNEIRKIPLLTASQEVELSKKMEAGLYAQYLLDTDDNISDTLMADLKHIAADGVRAREDFISSNIRLVINISKKYTGSGVELTELIHDGILGLIRAVEKFDYKAGIKFSTYATYWIRQFINRLKAEHIHVIHIPSLVVDKMHKIRVTAGLLEDRLGCSPTYDELAKEMKMDVKDVKRLASYSKPWLSFQSQQHFDDGDSRDTLDSFSIPDEGPTPDVLVEESDLRSVIISSMSGLTQEQHMLIDLKFGISDGRPRTYDEISKMTGLQVSSIRRTINSGIKYIQRNHKPELVAYYTS